MSDVTEATGALQLPAAATLKLVAIIEAEIAAHPHSAAGCIWAARPQSFYITKLGVSLAQFKRYIAKPPFVRLTKKVGSKKWTLLRVGEPAPKGLDEYAKLLRGVWRNKTGMQPIATDDEEGKAKWEYMKRCLWGYVKDVMAIPEVANFVPDPGALAFQAFVYVLDHWQEFALAAKLAAEAIPGYVVRYWDYPNIPVICRFNRAAVHVFVSHLQSAGKILPHELKASAALLDATDPFADYSGDASGIAADEIPY